MNEPSDTKILDAGEVAVIPILEEVLEISRTSRETGSVRVRVLIEETLSSQAVDLVQEVVTSTRVLRGVQARERVEPWNDGDTLIVPIYEEVVVTERRLMLKEEIHITRRVAHSTQLVAMPLRRERAVVERRSPDGSWIAEESERDGDDMASRVDVKWIAEHDAVVDIQPATAGASETSPHSATFDRTQEISR